MFSVLTRMVLEFGQVVQQSFGKLFGSSIFFLSPRSPRKVESSFFRR